MCLCHCAAEWTTIHDRLEANDLQTFRKKSPFTCLFLCVCVCVCVDVLGGLRNDQYRHIIHFHDSSRGEYLCTRDVLKSWLSHGRSSFSFSLDLSICLSINLSVFILCAVSPPRAFFFHRLIDDPNIGWRTAQRRRRVGRNYPPTGHNVARKNILLNDFFFFLYLFL